MMTLRWMLLGSVLGFSISMGLACGPSKCTPSSCQFGCCDQAGTCQTGGSDTACGQQGNMCSSCGLGLRCQLGTCTLIGGTGGGTSGGGTGGGTGGAQGGGMGGGTGGAQGGGTGGAQGGGTGGAQGGGTGGAQGGGTGGAQGGGTGGAQGGGTGGGTGEGTGLCATLQANANTFFAGMSSCGQISASNLPTSQCASALSSCNSTDQNLLSTFGTCIATVPCTSGNESAAQGNFFSCFGSLETLSGPCQSALQGGTGGGTGGGGPPTGGGTPVGGGTGGGAPPTGGGGGTPSCTPLGSPTAFRGDASYSSSANFELTSAGGITSATDPGDIIGFEVIWAINGVNQNPVVPGSQNLATGGTYNTCKYCTTLRRTCTDTGSGFNCTGGDYLGRVGTMSVSSAPRAATGSFTATLTNVTFQEWNLSTDQPVTNGRCFTVTSFGVNNLPVQ